MPKSVHPVKVELAARGEFHSELARATGLSVGMLSHYLNGRVDPPASVRERIADHLGRPQDELFGEAVDRLLAERAEQGHGDGFAPAQAEAITNVIARGGDA